MPGTDYLALSQSYLELAKDFSAAAAHLKKNVTELVDDTYPNERPLVDFQYRQKKLEAVAFKAAQHGWNAEEVQKKMTDLTGVRLICLHLAQIDGLVKLLKILEERSVIKIQDIENYIEKPKDSGYRSVHLDVQIRLPRQKREKEILIDVPCEIQIRTLIQHAWAERTHDLIYKPDSPPSEHIKTMFRIESLRLHGHQKSMDALWEMALWERQIMDTAESLNPLTIKGLAAEFDQTLSDQQSMSLYRDIRTATTAENISVLRSILKNVDVQAVVTEICKAQLRRGPNIKEKLIYGSILHFEPDEGRFRVELDIISSPEFRGQEVLPFDFGVIGRIEHNFSEFDEKAGGWRTYHTQNHTGTIRANSDEKGAPIGVELAATRKGSIFCAAYPFFAIAYPAAAVVTNVILEGNSCFYVLATTSEQETVFFEFGRERREAPWARDPKDGTLYVRSLARDMPEEPSVRANLADIAKSAGIALDIHLVHGFYCAANPRMVLSSVEIHKNKLEG